VPCNHKNIDENCKSCKELKDSWGKKLEKTGFEDIERSDGTLKRWDSFYFAREKHGHHHGGREFKEEYYRLAGHFLHDFPFKTDRDRKIWDLHAQGKTIKFITNMLKKQGYKINDSLVSESVSRLSTTMKSKLWI
jgi:hypothetical protein